MALTNHDGVVEALMSLTWFSRNARHVGECGWRRAGMSFSTVDFATVMPSLRSSTRIRGDPHVGFASHIRRIRSRTSSSTRVRPGLFLPLSLAQCSRKHLRCHWTTVLGFTNTSALRQPAQIRGSHAQKSRLVGRMRGRARVRC
jgi:hypothetical protein